MRLIHADTFEMKEFIGSGTPPYAILSHTWGDDEVSFHAMQSTWDKAAQAPSELATQEVWDNAMKTKGFMKIVNSCKQARLDGIEWVWVDTCCIDKTSSAELSEAINSMWAWYRDAWVCYAFLEDVPPLAPLLAPEEFASARWFTRGWCLQELIAPSKLEFYASDWTEMGTKSSLKQQLEGITGIPADALVGRKALSDYNVAQRMSWAAGRKTTRLEDEAYCLLGIFDINMPLLYGEGTHAFSRLQEQILMKTGDYSILLWTIPRLWEKDNGTSTGLFGVFARSPMQFANPPYPIDYRRIRQRTFDVDEFEPPQMTARGLRVYLRSLLGEGEKYEVFSGFMSADNRYICLHLWPSPKSLPQHGAYVRRINHPSPYYEDDGFQLSNVVLVDELDFNNFKLRVLYLPTDWTGLVLMARPPKIENFDIRICIIRQGDIQIQPESLAGGFQLNWFNWLKEALATPSTLPSRGPTYKNVVAWKTFRIMDCEVTIAVENHSNRVGIVSLISEAPGTSFSTNPGLLQSIVDRDIRRLPSGILYLAVKSRPENHTQSDYDPRKNRFPSKASYDLHIRLLAHPEGQAGDSPPPL